MHVHDEFHIGQIIECLFLGCGGLAFLLRHLAFREAARHLGHHVLLETADVQVLDVFLVVTLRIRQSGWVEHVHQRSKTASAAVMRRGGQHDQRVGTGGKAFGEFGALRAAAVGGTVGDILCLVDHDDVLIRGIECRAILDVPLQRVDGDDHLVVIGERVGVRGDLGTNLLDA